MSKRPKKRSKRYTGEDAKRPGVSVSNETTVHRYEAVQRSKLGEWWQSRKKFVRFVSIAGGAVLAISWLVFELIKTIF